MNPVIRLRGVRKSFLGFVLDVPALDIAPGYITGFIGENGAGKTTTMRLIMDIIHPDSGEITVLGGDMQRQAETLKQDIGYVDSLAYFHASFYVGKAKQIIAPFYKNWDEEVYQSYCKRFSISQEKKLKHLSTGQNKILSLIMALSHHPRLLILDEPTSGLDPVVRHSLLDILAEQMEREEVSVLYSTHITSDLDKTADFIVYIQEGRILLQGEKDRLLDEFRLVRGENSLLQNKAVCELLTGARQSEIGFTALTRDADALYAAAGDSVRMGRPTLEDIMVYSAKGGPGHA